MIAAPLVLATSMAYTRLKDEAMIMATRIPSPLNQRGEVLQGWAMGNTYARDIQTRIVTSTAKDKAIDQNIVEPTQIDAALGRLRSFARWGANWDGEGAPAPDGRTLDHAVTLLSLLARHPQTFCVDLDADGKPVFNLRGSDYEGYVLVEDDRTISFSFRRGGNVIDDYEIDFDGRRLPTSLIKALEIV